MRVPYLQIAMELIEQVAPDLAVVLEVEEATVGWGLMKLIKWGIGRCPDEAPPSEHDVVEGKNAALLIARAAGYRGDPEAFVDACERCVPALLERVPEGVRIRGFARYDSYWGKRHPDIWKEIQAKRRRTCSETVTDSEQVRHGIAPPDPDPDPDPDTEETTNQPPTPFAPVASGEPLAVVVEENFMGTDATGLPRMRTRKRIQWQPTVPGLWAFFQMNRELHGEKREAHQPKGFAKWAQLALSDPGPDGIVAAHSGFLEDPTIHKPGHPTGVFISPGCWDARRPSRDEHASQ